MRLKSLASLALAFVLPAAATAVQNGAGGPGGVQVNKDLQNLGPAAYDVAIVLQGSETLTNSFNGYHSGDIVGWFNAPTTTTVGGNTVIHWQTFRDDDNNQIDRNQTIHVGYSTNGSHTVVDMYWTDINGNRIPGSVVYDVKANATYRTNRFSWTLSNQFANAADIAISNVRFAVLSSPLPLGDLSRNNIELANALSAIDGGLTLAPGEARSIDLPVAVAPGSAVVLVYEVSAPESSAVVTNYVQAIAQ
jgi:hypothetical protein